jgi:hypothetical protein
MLDLPTEETDAQGRKLTFRKLNALEQSRVDRAAGDHSGNQQYMMKWVYPAASVAAINGVPMPVPRDMRTIEATIAELGDDGMNVCIRRVLLEMQDAKARLDVEMAKEQPDPLAPSAP